jgi:N-terminal acetyltransferase B complex non-catalytic subunit
VVLEKAQLVKKGLDEGGWIDRVIDGGLPIDGEAQATADVLRELVDDNYIEEWAGLAVESWGESVQGLSHIKPLK